MRYRLSQHATKMGDRAEGLLFGDQSTNKTRPTRKNWASTLLALVPAAFELGLRETDIGPG
jgi:hypothetical protein